MDQLRGRHERRTWVFDATFLRSNWSCIYGAGCKGVLDVRRHRARPGLLQLRRPLHRRRRCADRARRADPARPRHWQNYKKGHKQGRPGDRGRRHQDPRRRRARASSTTSPDFAGGAGCALHIAAVEAGERPIDWKPDVCWQLPLRLEHHTDDNGYVTSTLREWKRRDWGDGGNDFHWWCTESDDAFVGGVAGLPVPARRDHRDGRPSRLRQDGDPARTPQLDPAPPPRHPAS